jgi:hypothetical protein
MWLVAKVKFEQQEKECNLANKQFRATAITLKKARPGKLAEGRAIRKSDRAPSLCC